MLRLLAILLLSFALPAQTPPPPKPPILDLKDEKPVTTSHTITLNGRPLKYTATTGYLPFRNDQTGDIEAQMFYVAYTADPANPKRPLTICFNGGPGAGSVWLHMGAIGPKRVRMLDDGNMPPPPYIYEDNQGTWLEKSDLVFVDPIGTGYSRPKSQEIGRKFWGLQGDIASVGTFVRRYLDLNKRWNSPLYLAGESYGTTRASGLSNYLFEHGISLNGIFLISTIMNFQTARFTRGNDLPYSLFLPTYTAIAHYHKKLPADLQTSLEKAVTEARAYAQNEYPSILQKGDQLSPAERKAATDKLARLTGLSPEYIAANDLRIEIQRFCKELLRKDGKSVGRLDGRITGNDSDPDPTPDFDPSLTAIRGPYTAAMNQYARELLNFDTDREYYALGGGIGRWDFGISETGAGQGYADTSEPLSLAMRKNPYMKVLLANGYFDLATPFHAAEYTVAHMQLPTNLRKNVSFTYYPAGHMMYVHVPSLLQLRKDFESFVDTK